MVLTHLVKISGLIQIICNLSINVVYIAYQIMEEAIPNGTIPRYLPLNILILLCIIPGYISLQIINDKPLKVILLITNLIITGVVFVIYFNVFKTYVAHA
ncbi:hypothetical protein BH09BAC1_BH09BAC1_18890 [soil metagenome]